MSRGKRKKNNQAQLLREAEMAAVRNGNFKSYEEFCEIKEQSRDKWRNWFEAGWHYYNCEFKGLIEKITSDKVLFTRIIIEIAYLDGSFAKGKEDHVWMDKAGFEEYKPGDCVSFCAEIYQYLKTGNGKMIDFALENPEDIQKIERYEIPTDEELIRQQLEQIMCETCMYNEKCYAFVNGLCLANEEEYNSDFTFLRDLEPGKFTPFTVIAAWTTRGSFPADEIIRLPDKEDPKYEVIKKIIERSREATRYCRHVGGNGQLISYICYPEKPRIYIQ